MPLTVQNSNLLQRKNPVSTVIVIYLTLQTLVSCCCFFTKENSSYYTTAIVIALTLQNRKPCYISKI